MTDASRETNDPAPEASRLDALRSQLQTAFGAGAADPLESWLDRFSDVSAREVRIAYLRAEMAAIQSRQETLSPEDFYQRYPQARTEIDSVLSDLADTQHFEGGDETQLPGDLPGNLFSAASMSPGGAGSGGESSPAPEQLGDYKLLDKLGEGGMGLVYSARQTSADRVVALKIVRPERLQAYSFERRKNVIDRFRTEAQSAAQLEHENIVTVYDVGEIDGQHYYSMRLVDGCSLADLLSEGPLLNDVAARYLRDTARGIAEAHGQGILHRDLKPQNVMVDSKTDRAMVADFGLAKIVDGDTELTRDGEIVGTPQYMAPEQIQDSAHVTSSADIYAIGATLYHLLTGRPPFQAALAVDTLRQVMMQDPVPPRQLNAAIDLDLETICLKCLEKEPARRYETAAMVADELDRYLRNEPILARPLGPMGRLLRWRRRNPGLATAVGAAIVGLLLALTATTIGYVSTSRAQAKSEQSFRDALGVVNVFFSEVSEDSLLHAQGMQMLRKELLTLALDYYQKFLHQRANDPTVRKELAGAYYRVGLITAELDAPEAALPYYNDALRMQDDILAKSPRDPELLRGRGNIQNALGVAYTQLEKLDEALERFRIAREARQKWADLEPDSVEPIRVLANTTSNIAHAFELKGDAVAALREFEAAQSLREKLLAKAPQHKRGRRDYAEGFYNQANFRFELAKRELKADEFLKPKLISSLISQLQKAVDQFKELQAEDASDISVRFQLSRCQRLMGDLYGEEQDADRAYQQAREQLEVLTLQNPTVPFYQLDLAAVYIELGRLENNRNQFRKMAEHFEAAIRLMTPWVGDEAPAPLRLDLANSHMDLAIAYGVQAEDLDFAAEKLVAAAKAKPADAEPTLQQAKRKRADAEKKRKAAIDQLRVAVRITEALLAADKESEELQMFLEDCQGLITEMSPAKEREP